MKILFTNIGGSQMNICILILIAFLCSIMPCDSIENGWKGIKPLETNKTEADKILGEPEVDEFGYYTYSSEETFIRVSYSTNPCTESKYGRGDYNTAVNTVLSYTVRFNNLTKLSELKFDLSKFVEHPDSHVTNYKYYYNKDQSIIIGVQLQGDREYLLNIRFMPNKNTANQLKCTSLSP